MAAPMDHMILSKLVEFFVFFGVIWIGYVNCSPHIAFLSSQDTKQLDICNLVSCSKAELYNQSYVFEQCSDFSNLTVNGRCCVNVINETTVDVIGVDWSQCDVTSTSQLLQHERLKWIVLEDNPLLENDTEFKGLNELEYLSLPGGLACPGGDDSWQSVNYTSDVTVCEYELDACVAQNVSCPNRSSCFPNGPGLTLCLCKHDYFGYKCLRWSQFPYILYTLTLCGLTLIVSVFLWTTQRIRVKRKKER